MEGNLKSQSGQNIISGDAVRLQQIFWNVLKNAIKFTPKKGRVTIETRSGGHEYTVIISDTGIGMTTKELEEAFNSTAQTSHFFERFDLAFWHPATLQSRRLLCSRRHAVAEELDER